VSTVPKSTETKNQSQLSTRLFNRLKPEQLKLPEDDSRQLKHLCKQRRTLLMELRGYCNSDGTHVEPAVKTLAESLGCGQASVYRRLDDLKKLGLLVDEERIGFNKPRRRHLNLLRAAELVGVILGQRPADLPACIPTELWLQFLPLITGGVEYVVGMIRHEFHLADQGRAESFILECIRHSIKIGFITNDLWLNGMLACSVEGCHGYQRQLVDLDAA
jgi:helix-turn-helix protein